MTTSFQATSSFGHFISPISHFDPKNSHFVPSVTKQVKL